MYFSECHHIPKKSIFVEVKEFVKGIPYGQMLREMNRTPRARFRLIDHEYAQAVAETLHRIHTVKPQGSDFDLDEGSFEDTIKRVYRKSIRDILDRLLVNTPADITHPYITKQIRGQLLDYGSELVQKWSGRWHEACAQHGDARTDNYIITTEYKKRPMAVPIDFSRVEWCHPGFDNGRFVADLIEHVFDSDSHQHQKIVGTFLDTSMRLSKDPHYLESLCFGVFSILLIKLNPERDPIRDPRLAKRFLEFCMGTLKTGYLSW